MIVCTDCADDAQSHLPVLYYKGFVNLNRISLKTILARETVLADVLSTAYDIVNFGQLLHVFALIFCRYAVGKSCKDSVVKLAQKCRVDDEKVPERHS